MHTSTDLEKPLRLRPCHGRRTNKKGDETCVSVCVYVFACRPCVCMCVCEREREREREGEGEGEGDVDLMED